MALNELPILEEVTRGDVMMSEGAAADERFLEITGCGETEACDFRDPFSRVRNSIHE